jgi:hypothetical protein
MADSDYTIRGSGAFAGVARLAADVSYLTSTLYWTNYKTNGTDPVVGDGVMVDDEIMRITSIGTGVIGVARGCYDTIPAPHSANADIWLFKNSIATDRRAYIGTETIGVKILPYTSGGGMVPVGSSPPNELTFNFRFARPYPPANVLVNGDPWFTFGFMMLLDDDELAFTWVHRDRVVQSDQLVGHTEASVGPEAGTTYVVRFYDEDDNLVAEYDAISGTSFTYTMAMAQLDYVGLISEPADPINVYALLMSSRDDLDSTYAYRIDFMLDYIQPYGLGFRLGESLGGVTP